jgi:hypothetical protein
MKVKIISGYTDKGGSTVAFITLTNFLNDNGIDCTLYGNQDYHLDKCKSDKIQNLKIEKDDRLIYHFTQIETRPDAEVVVLSCHEKWWFPVGKIKKYFDKVIFLHQQHREYHSDYTGDFVIIPNLKEDLKKKDKPEVSKVAGIIGTIEERKQTHISIIRAKKDKCEKIYLFGHIGDENYFNKFVKPLLSPEVVVFGHTTNKQDMYDMIGRVYHSSKGEVACLVKDESYLTGTEFFGNEETQNEVSELSNQQVLELWKKVLKL